MLQPPIKLQIFFDNHEQYKLVELTAWLIDKGHVYGHFLEQ
jgi:hypothetical protein